jgi:DNA-binding transcriptional MerR regulator/mannose-6-phosphate isomerase-like protein (cupin superfamily)
MSRADQPPHPSDTGRESMTITEVAQAAGVSAETLRAWERERLLVPQRTPGGHRRYPPDLVARARHIAELRRVRAWNIVAIRAALGDHDAHGPSPEGQEWAGTTIAGARRRRGLSVTQAARLIGVEPDYLRSVERGESGVSTRVVARMADAYLVPMAAFGGFRSRRQALVRREERETGEMLGGVVWEELATPGHHLDPAIVHVPAGEGSGGSYTRPSDCLLHVLAGRLQVIRGADDLVTLLRGDSLMLPGGEPVAWVNPGRSTARFLWVQHVVVPDHP